MDYKQWMMKLFPSSAGDLWLTMEAIRIGKQTFTFSINTSFHEEFLCTMGRPHSHGLNETSIKQNH